LPNQTQQRIDEINEWETQKIRFFRQFVVVLLFTERSFIYFGKRQIEVAESKRATMLKR